MDALPPPPPAIYASAPVHVCKRWGWSNDRQHVWCITWVKQPDKETKK